MFFYLKKESIYFFRIFGPLIFLLPFLNAKGFDPVTGERLDSNYKYFTIHAGMGFGTLEKFYAESAFSDPDNPSRPLWTANVLDVKTANKFPQIALKFGGWKSWFGGEMEMSYLGHKIPEQIVYYDSYGKILIDHNIHSLTDTPFYFTIEPQDSVDLPESFLSFNSFSFGGSGYVSLPLTANLIGSIGVGLSISMNNVTSEYPGPGNYAAKNVMAAYGYDIRNAKSLSATDIGWGYYLPVRINYIIKNDTFLTTEFRLSRKHISFVGSDAYLKEKDETILQTLQINIGIGKFLK